MEWRAAISVPTLDIESDEADGLMDALMRLYSELGPVLSGAADRLDVTLATEQEDPAAAAAEMYLAVSAALLAIGRGDLYPTQVELELVGEPQTA